MPEYDHVTAGSPRVGNRCTACEAPHTVTGCIQRGRKGEGDRPRPPYWVSGHLGCTQPGVTPVAPDKVDGHGRTKESGF